MCVYVCMYGWMDVCMHVCMYVRTYVCMYVCTYVCMYVCMYAFMYVCMHVCMHAYMYACMHVCMYVCVYLCMHVSIYVGTSLYSIMKHTRQSTAPTASCSMFCSVSVLRPKILAATFCSGILKSALEEINTLHIDMRPGLSVWPGISTTLRTNPRRSRRTGLWAQVPSTILNLGPRAFRLRRSNQASDCMLVPKHFLLGQASSSS